MRYLRYIVIFLLILVCSLFVFVTTFNNARNVAIEQLYTQEKILAEQAASGIQAYFAYHEEVLTFLTSNENVVANNAEGKKILKAYFSSQPGHISAITRMDRHGTVIYSYPDETIIGRDISHQAHVQKILSDHQPTISDVFLSVQGYQAVAFHYPVIDHGAFSGSVGILIPFEQISKQFIESIQVGKSGYAILLAANGTELYCPFPGHIGRSIFETSRDNPSVIAMAKEIQKGGEGTYTYSYDDLSTGKLELVAKHSYYKPIPLKNTFWTILITTPEKEALSYILNFQVQWIVSAGLLFLGLILWVIFLMRSLFMARQEVERRNSEAHIALAEQEKVKALALLDTAINQSPLGLIIAYAPDANIWIANPAALAIRGPSDLPLTGISYEHQPPNWQIYTVDGQPFPAEEFPLARAVRNGEAVKNKEFSIRNHKGEERRCSADAAPIVDAQGNILAGIMIFEDVTEKKLVEENLRESEAKFRTLFEDSTEANLILRDDVFIDCNASALKMLGATRADVVGHTPNDLSPLRQPDGMLSSDKSRLMMQAALHSGSHKFEWLHHTPQKSDFWVEVILTRIMLDGKLHLYTTWRDITDRKNAERDLISANRSLRITSRCNLALVRALDQQSLFEEICRIMVNEGDYAFVWIGLLNGNREDALLPTSFFGKAGITLKSVQNAGESKLLCCLPFLEAIRAQKPIVIQDITLEPRCSACHQEARTFNLISAIGLPLTYHGERYGSIALVSEKRDSFTTEEIEMLQSIADDLSFGIYTLKVRSAHVEVLNQIQQANKELTIAYDTTLDGWSRALELRERETAGHSRRVVEMTMRIAEKMGIPPAQFADIRWGAYLHDIGKIGIPDSILLKPGPLSDEEWVIMRQHPVYAHKLLSPIGFLKNALDIPYAHHEHWDGSGYPRGLKGPEIPLAARIFAVVDVLDALTSDRPYRPAWSKEAARSYLIQKAGILFDPQVVDVLMKLDDAWPTAE